MNKCHRGWAKAFGAALALVVGMCALPASQASTPQQNPQGASPAPDQNGPYLTEGRRYQDPTLQRFANQNPAEVQEAISALPGYTVFDDIEFTISKGLDQVTLLGHVTDPEVARQAVEAVRNIPGITSVMSRITFLGPSESDARLRQAAYDAIYNNPRLNRYRGENNPPIHIIVDNGRVTLVGVVGDAADRTLAYQRMTGLPGLASVSNELKVDPYAASNYQNDESLQRDLK